MRSISEEAIYELTAKFYEGAAEMNCQLWQAAYEDVSKLISSGPGTIHFRHKSDNNFEPIANTNVEGFINRFNELYFHILPYRKEFLSLKSGGEFLRTRDFPDEKFLESEFYEAHFEELGLYEILHYCLFDDDLVTGGVTFSRPKEAAAFTREERDAVLHLLPHMQKAARLHLKLSRLSITNRIMAEAWNQVSHPVVVISSKRNVIFMNDAGERLVRERNGFWFGSGGSVEATLPRDAKTLKSLINGVFEDAGKSAFGGQAIISRKEHRPLGLTVAPFLEQDRLALGGEKFALILVSDPENEAGSTEDDLRTAFRLTRSEARVARMLADGLALAQVCERLEISQNTVRTHLKRIYAKTHTNRQGSLVKLVLSGTNPGSTLGRH